PFFCAEASLTSHVPLRLGISRAPSPIRLVLAVETMRRTTRPRAPPGGQDADDGGDDLRSSLSSTTRAERNGRGKGGGDGPGAAAAWPETPSSADGASTVAAFVVACLAASKTSEAEQAVDRHLANTSLAACRSFYFTVMSQGANVRCPPVVAWCLEQLQQKGHALDTGIFNSVMNAYAKMGDVKSAEHFWHVMEDCCIRPNIVSFNTMINACAQARDVKRAAWWFSAIQSAGWQPNRISFGTMISSHAKLGNVDEAEALAGQMGEAGLQRDEVVYNSLINACAKAGAQQRAEHWMRAMLGEGIVPNQRAFSGLIQACVRSSDLSKAEEWFDCIEKVGGSTDMIAFNSMIHVAAKIGNVKQAEHWMSRMIRRISHGITPNVVCLNTLLHAFARRGAYKHAVEWVARMRAHNVTPNRITFNTMLHASIAGGEPKDTEQWLRCMVQEGLHPDKVTVSTLLTTKRLGMPVSAEREQWVYQTVARTYEALGDRHSAETWWGQKWKDPGAARGQEGGQPPQRQQPEQAEPRQHQQLSRPPGDWGEAGQGHGSSSPSRPRPRDASPQRQRGTSSGGSSEGWAVPTRGGWQAWPHGPWAAGRQTSGWASSSTATAIPSMLAADPAYTLSSSTLSVGFSRQHSQEVPSAEHLPQLSDEGGQPWGTAGQHTEMDSQWQLAAMPWPLLAAPPDSARWGYDPDVGSGHMGDDKAGVHRVFRL
ncbi:unnamed protein product, partial [Prorocentrum cordatum]